MPNHFQTVNTLPHPDTVGCAGYRQLQSSRRQWLALKAASAATLGWMTGGSGLTVIAEQLARDAETKRQGTRPKSLLMLWLQGGPSQLETFDPHPGTLYGGEVKAISTSIAGCFISDLLPATAEQLHHACVVRSVVSKEGDHERATYHLKTGWRPDPTLVHPSIGAIICHQSPENLEIPRHVSILASQWPARGGYLGPSVDAFQIGDPNDQIPNLKAAVDSDTLNIRAGRLLDVLESEFQRGRMIDLDGNRTLHRTATNRALQMMSSEQLSAFEVQLEGDETLKRFGNSGFGRGCLAAVRLLATGVRCVEVELAGWDTHINNHQLQAARAAELDLALAATLQELSARGLLDDTIVFCGGEFGRTPQINPAGGRDHWPHGFSVLLAGGRFRRGHVHGETAAVPDLKQLMGDNSKLLDASRVTNDIVTVADLHATLLNALGIRHTDEHITPIGRPMRWSDGDLIKSLLS